MAYLIGVNCSLGAGPDAGGRSRNEDNFLVCENGKVRYLINNMEESHDQEGDGVVVAVFDGMGGHDDGHIASLTAAKVMAKLYRRGLPTNPERVLVRYVREAHETLYWKMAEVGEVTTGTTLVVAWFMHGTLTWISVGDSRLYRMQDDILELMTLDHTRNEFARRDASTLVSPDGDHLCQSFIYGSRGLGDNSSVRVDSGLDSGTLPVSPGECFLLCTDGVWSVLDEEDLVTLLLKHSDPDDAAEAICHSAIRAGAKDNVTALVIRVKENRPPQVDWTDDFDAFRTLG